MAYDRVNWQNQPSTATPVNADNLNKMDKGINDLEEGKIPKSDIVQTDTINDPNKVPSSAVTHALGQQVTQLNNNLDNLIETGTFTPKLYFGGADTGITYASYTKGNYTVIGNIVKVDGVIWLTSKGSAIGNATVDGFPFPVKTGLLQGTIQRFDWLTVPSGTISLSLSFLGGQTTASLLASVKESNRVPIDNTNFADNSTIYFNFSYIRQ